MHEKARILIVDDDGLIRLLLRRMLTKCGYTCLYEASDGAKAKVLLAEKRFDLMILDLQLPDMDGLTLCQYVQDNQLQVPILLISGSVVDWRPYLRAGVADCLNKPISMRDLRASVERVLNAHLRQPAPALTPNG